ncbi:PREDICTED: odorant receptor 13a-like [Acromyrmex echinatior]|uniref:odorant receptor 13a-like n=1 Tax=Acromyrmex echinatior TaxID=103372 RepID=UPI000580CA5B|nr:PREDICTED: odorant receptor 13a-like [Acromyrmex echinatior]
MAIDWEKCSRKKFSMFVTSYNAKLSERFANMTVILYSTAVILYSTHILRKHVDDGNASNISTRLLVLEMDLPFDTNKRFVYESILHIGGQIDILRQNLMAIFSKKEKDNLSHFMIKKIIKKHQNIITFSQHIEDLYSYIAMVLFVSDTLIICCLGFTIVASIGGSDVLKNITRTLLFYLVMNMEAFIFCFGGEYLSAKSKSIGDAAYASHWYESGPRNSRIILFLIMRSQIQLTITIGKIMNLSLERFTSLKYKSAKYKKFTYVAAEYRLIYSVQL